MRKNGKNTTFCPFCATNTPKSAFYHFFQFAGFCTASFCNFEAQKHKTLKELAFCTTDNEYLYFVQENRILEAAENEDGTTTLAIVEIIDVKTPIDQIRKELSKTHRNRIQWHTLSRPS